MQQRVRANSPTNGGIKNRVCEFVKNLLITLWLIVGVIGAGLFGLWLKEGDGGLLGVSLSLAFGSFLFLVPLFFFGDCGSEKITDDAENEQKK